jgi:hypothetical protein
MSTEEPITTRLGHAGWHDHEVRGVVVFDIDPGQTSVPDLLLLTLGVPRTHEAHSVIHLCTMAGLNPDPRIPPMKLVRLGAAYGSPLSALAAGFAGLQSSYVGMTAVADAARFLCELQSTLGWDFDDDRLDRVLRERRRARADIFGFGVPGRPTRLDEALSGPRPWWRLFERTGALLSRYRRRPNLGGALAAAMLDIGCTPEQAQAAACLFGLLPLLGNAFEGAVQAPELLRELPADTVEYAGRPARTSPRANAQRDDKGDSSGSSA